MLPIPFVNFIPSFFTRDTKLIAFADKIDSNLSDWKDDVLDLNTMIDPARINILLLDDVGDYLSAGILDTDSERTKRQKISIAIVTHKDRGTWINDVKPTIDSIVGGDSQLFGSSGDSSDFILLGGETDDPDYYWGTIGFDNIDLDLGVDIVGEGIEPVLAGIFQIDVDSSTLTTEEVETLKLALEDKISVYFRVFLGYISSGEFIKYANGQIN